MTETEIRRISYSELKNFTECSYRHKLIYIDKLPYFSGNEYTAFGTAIHAVCEEVIPDNSKNAMEIFELNFLNELIKLKEDGHELNKNMVSDMRQQARPICEQVIPAVKDHFGEFEVVSVEEQLLEPMSDIESYGKKFKGFIDMVIKTPDDKYHIIDWKTCSWGWTRDKKSDAMTTYQLTYYKNYFSKKTMIIIDVTKEKNIETALKKYKYKVQKTKQNEKLRERQQFVKPSVSKRSKKLKAVYKQKLNRSED